jgi:hypothetical protein
VDFLHQKLAFAVRWRSLAILFLGERNCQASAQSSGESAHIMGCSFARKPGNLIEVQPSMNATDAGLTPTLQTFTSRPSEAVWLVVEMPLLRTYLLMFSFHPSCFHKFTVLLQKLRLLFGHVVVCKDEAAPCPNASVDLLCVRVFESISPVGSDL